MEKIVSTPANSNSKEDLKALILTLTNEQINLVLDLLSEGRS